jgi:hypothetical protein
MIEPTDPVDFAKDAPITVITQIVVVHCTFKQIGERSAWESPSQLFVANKDDPLSALYNKLEDCALFSFEIS